MTKVQVLTCCDHCQGQAYLPTTEAQDAQRCSYIRHIPCPACEGSGLTAKWVSLQELAVLLAQAQCPHTHTSYRGRLRFSAGDVWDNLQEVCNDCGATLDRQTLADYIHDPEEANLS